MRVYFAGPLFTPYERSFIDECAARLRAEGIDVFVPHENALAGGDMSAATIFAKDWQGLSEADAVVAVLDGPMVDDGTACEIGIFYALMQSDSNEEGHRRPAHGSAWHASPRRPRPESVRPRLYRGGGEGVQLDGRGRSRARRLALVPAASILARTPLLIRPAAVAFPSVAVGRRAGITLAAVFAGTPVASGTPVTT